jgi:hypothetical protein
MGYYFRNPKTTQERRMAGAVMTEEGEPPPRAARGPKHLVTAWDDIPRGFDRTWKRHRRAQWKTPA